MKTSNPTLIQPFCFFIRHWSWYPAFLLEYLLSFFQSEETSEEQNKKEEPKKPQKSTKSKYLKYIISVEMMEYIFTPCFLFPEKTVQFKSVPVNRSLASDAYDFNTDFKWVFFTLLEADIQTCRHYSDECSIIGCACCCFCAKVELKFPFSADKDQHLELLLGVHRVIWRLYADKNKKTGLECWHTDVLMAANLISVVNRWNCVEDGLYLHLLLLPVVWTWESPLTIDKILYIDN